MAILVRVRVPGTGEHIDDGTELWDGQELDTVTLSAEDLGCAPGTEYVLELVVDDTQYVIESLTVTAR